MQTLHLIEDIKKTAQDHRDKNLTIGFVPTMGNLHQGHLRLVEVAKAQADIVVASIFVNPMQFGADEDLDKYPRTLQEDQEKLASLGTDFLFAPSPREMYPNGLENHLKINMPHMAGVLCGKSRPTHFEGVCTVVTKLFNIVKPHVAVFGKKDLQQLLIIKQMTEDLCLDIKVEGVDTEREESGLAMSSRNSLLSEEEKQQASIINKLLKGIKTEINQGATAYSELVVAAKRELDDSLLKTDYLEIRELKNFGEAKDGERYDNLGVFAAAYAENTRLIDNITTGKLI